MARADWEAIGLTGNPFINVVPGEHLEWVELPPGLDAALAVRPSAVELVGVHKGAGKSTALKAVIVATPGSRYHHAQQPLSFETLAGVTLFALDEANLWPARAVTELGKHARASGMSLLFGTHHSLAFLIPGLTSLHLDRLPTWAWLERRVVAATLPAAAPFDFVALGRTISLHFQHVKYGVLRVLYELAEELARGERYTPALLDACVERAIADDTVRALLPSGRWIPAARP